MAAEASRQIISIEINYQVPNLPNLGLQSIRVHCHFDSSGGRVFELYIIVQNGLHKVEAPEFLSSSNHIISWERAHMWGMHIKQGHHSWQGL